MSWDGMGYDEMWEGMGRDVMGWDGMDVGQDGMGWDEMRWECVMGWDGMGWDKRALHLCAFLPTPKSPA